MSLGSLVANLFPGSATKSQEDRSQLGFADDGLEGGKQTFADANFGAGRFRSENMAPKAVEEEEEEGRPPYLHVSRRVSYESIHTNRS